MPRSLIAAVPRLRALLTLLTVVGLGGALGACGADDPAPPAAPARSTPATAPGTGAVATTRSAPIRFPRDVAAPEQGGTYVAVVLAAGDADTTADADAIERSRASVATYGYTAGVSHVGCLRGLQHRLDLPAGTTVSSLLFADRRTARRFANAYIAAEDGAMVGRVPVTAYCLD